MTTLTRRTALAWTAALLIPNLLLFIWLFRGVHPQTYFAELYRSDADNPIANRTPAALLALSILITFGLRIVDSFPDRLKTQQKAGVSEWLLCVLLAALLAAGIGWGFGMSPLFSLAQASIGLIILIAAAGAGFRFLRCPLFGAHPLRFASRVEALVLATAIGLGLLALLVFVAGSFGLLSPWLWWPIVIGLAALNAPPLRTRTQDIGCATGSDVAAASGTQYIATVAIIFTCLWVGIHALLVWSPPLEYDVLEYHLAAPAQYLRAGQVSFLHENIFATFPENGEMLYLLGMILSGEKLRGLPAAHFVLFGCWALTVCGVYALIQRLLNAAGKSASPAAALGALLYALIPLGSQLAADFYVEHIQALSHLAALMAACIFFIERRAGKSVGAKEQQPAASAVAPCSASPQGASRTSGLLLGAPSDCFGWLTLAGVAAGFCCGAKYTGLLFTLGPLALLVPVFCFWNGSLRLALRAAVAVCAPALLAFSPWLLRNLWAVRDPLYPLGTAFMRKFSDARQAPGRLGDFDVSFPYPERLDHFKVAIRMGDSWLKDFGAALRQLFPSLKSKDGWLQQFECGPQLLFFAIPGCFASVRPETLLVLGVFLLDVLLWIFFSHRVNRFMYPQFSVLAVIGAVGIARLWEFAPLRKTVGALCIGAVLLVAPLACLYPFLLARPALMTGDETPEAAARAQYHAFGNASWYESWHAVNMLPPGAKVLFVGDAQTFYLNRTPVYNAVFNPSVLEDAIKDSETPEDVSARLKSQGVTHIYFNYAEWFRLDTSYALEVRDFSGGQFWQRAEFDPELSALLRQRLLTRRIFEYGRAWPYGVFPAYLKLNLAEYQRLDEFVRKYTREEWSWTANGFVTCELRRIEVVTGTNPSAAPR